MIFDTDILIWVQRGNEKAANLIDDADAPKLSVQSYLELLQCANSKIQHKTVKDFLHDYNFEVLPISEIISHRAAVYVEEYSLSHGVRAGDAFIAATAIEHHLPLVTGNKKHFSCISDLNLKIFSP